MNIAAEPIYQLTIPTPFPVGPVHVYLICGELVTLFDSGPLTKKGMHELERQLASIGYKLDDIDQIILSHHHPDHIGLTNKFKRAKTIGHEKLRPWLEKNELFFQQYTDYLKSFYVKNGVPPELMKKIESASHSYLNYTERRSLDIIVKEGDNVPGLPGWIVHEVPGHAQNHIMIMREEDRLALGADVLLASVSSNALLEAPMEGEERPKTLLQYRDSLRKVRDLEISVLMPGHGEMIKDVDSLVEQRLLKHTKRAEAILEILSFRKMNANQIAYELFQEKHRMQPDLTISETIGHLDLLLEYNQVKTKEIDEYTLYFIE
ncbi:lactamase B [Halalkalibacter wakoensis JCM 9140]|uniref:Lactamase B n=1 Tax=Halalkalibacter wakoensis JCM 9140 TaxID=1236970 RepID=W4Q2Y3_9BACI|nr:MBL fold metallo-hydrolase [Halalkalibacter wakoensis]GAE26352.1 lactamase B [Halalkalibacter wakoensis JCM 9140]